MDLIGLKLSYEPLNTSLTLILGVVCQASSTPWQWWVQHWDMFWVASSLRFTSMPLLLNPAGMFDYNLIYTVIVINLI